VRLRTSTFENYSGVLFKLTRRSRNRSPRQHRTYEVATRSSRARHRGAPGIWRIR
jgi:hypothetical protein